MQLPSTYSGMCHVNLREDYVEDMDRLTETMQGEASAFSGILMGKPMDIPLTHSLQKMKTTKEIQLLLMITRSNKAQHRAANQ